MRFSYSDIKSFKSCRRKWDLSSKNRQGWRKKRKADALFLGSGIHKALEFYYRKGWDLKKTFLAWYNHQINEMIIKTNENRLEMKKEVINNREDFRSMINEFGYNEQKVLGLKMLENYSDTFNNIVKTEKYITMDIGMGNHLSGRIDGIEKDKDGFLWNVEHKTAKNFNPDKLDTNEQPDFYTLFASLVYEKDIVGTIYNVLLKDYYKEPRVLQSGELSTAKNQGTSYKLYMKKAKEIYEDDIPNNIIKYSEWLKKNEKELCVQHKIYKTKKEQHNFKIQLLDTINDMLDNRRIYKNPGLHCNWCDYKEVCLEMDKGGNWKDLLKVEFEK